MPRHAAPVALPLPEGWPQRVRSAVLHAISLYKIHYLRWTGHETLDRVLGVAGLALLSSWPRVVAGCSFGGRPPVDATGSIIQVLRTC